jgi:hypothetical protein
MLRGRSPPQDPAIEDVRAMSIDGTELLMRSFATRSSRRLEM